MPKIARPGFRRLELWLADDLVEEIDRAAGERGRNHWISQQIAKGLKKPLREMPKPKLGRPPARKGRSRST